MKRFLINIVFMSQFWESSAMESLVSQNFFNAGSDRFHQVLNTAIRDVHDGVSTPDNAIVMVKGAYQNQLRLIRTQLNEVFSERIQEAQQKADIKHLTMSAQHEIDTLQAQIRNSSQGANLSFFEAERRRAEENVRNVLADTKQHTFAQELLTSRQVDRTMERFTKELNKIREEIRSGHRTLEEAFGRTEEKYADSIVSLIDNLKDRYEDIVNSIGERHEEEKARLRNAYDQQKAVLERMLEETNSLNAKLEKDKRLCAHVSRIFFANPSLEPKKMLIRAADVERTEDIFKKRVIVEDIYKKFDLFSGLYGNVELGVTATLEDLNLIRTFLELSKVTAVEPVREPNVDVHVYPNRGWFEESQYNRMIALYNQFFGSDPDGHSGGNYGIALAGSRRLILVQWRLDLLVKASDRVNQELEERYNDALAVYNADVNCAKSIEFPTDAFNHLVDQFNEFVNRL